MAAVDEKPFAIHVIAFTQIFLQQQIRWLVIVAEQMTQRLSAADFTVLSAQRRQYRDRQALCGPLLPLQIDFYPAKILTFLKLHAGIGVS